MKKLLLLVVMLFSLVFVACGASDNTNADSDNKQETTKDSQKEDEDTKSSETPKDSEAVKDSESTGETEPEESEDVEVDYSAMRSVTIGTLTVRYDDCYYKARSGSTVKYYGDYLAELAAMYESMPDSTSSTDANCYGSHSEFEEDGVVTPIWEMYAKNIDGCSTITEYCAERGTNERYSWGRYSSLPEGLKDVLNEVLVMLYNKYFMSETELGSNLGGTSNYTSVDSLLRTVEYGNYGPTSYKLDDGQVVQSYGDRESFSWRLEGRNFTEDEWPIEKYHYFSIETESGMEYYSLNITEANASQMLSTNQWFSIHGIPAISDEFADVYNSFIKLEMSIYRYYPE